MDGMKDVSRGDVSRGDVYVVFRRGYERQECGGIFATQARAMEVARSMLAEEPNDYHRYEVSAFPFDRRTALDPDIRWTLREPPVLVTLRRDGDRILEESGKVKWYLS